MLEFWRFAIRYCGIFIVSKLLEVSLNKFLGLLNDIN
ncbi:hypothetical protein NIES4106_42680 [Fischerella sp. NIES-4106]|nr:hypothetical protein NIES4106_42680 [Fischerella sp. NIES-4106]